LKTPGQLSFFTSIDEIKSQDLAKIYLLDKLYFPAPWTKEAWESFFLNHHAWLLSLFYESKEGLASPVGFALWQNQSADSFSHLLKIVLDPNRRGLGEGEFILKNTLAYLHSHGIKNYFLEVEERNDSAIKLYLKLGFKTIHKKTQFYTNGDNALIMTLAV